VANEILLLAGYVLCHPDRALAFQEPHNACHRKLRGDRDKHMNVIRHQMPFLDLAVLLGGKAMKHIFKLFADGAKKSFLSVFWREHYMIFAFPCTVI
jgi:hypothetical protein